MPQNPSGTKAPSWGWLEGFLGVIFLLTITGFCGRYGWWLDLAATFRFQYLVLSTIGALFAAWVRRPRFALLYAMCAAINLAVIAPLYWREPAPSSQSSERLRVMLLALHPQDSDPERVAKAIRDSKANVVVVDGVTDHWQQQLGSSLKLYPYVFSEDRKDSFGIAILSTHPRDSGEMTWFGDGEVPSLVTQFIIGKQHVQIIATHTVPSLGPASATLRDGQLSDLGTYVKRRASLRRAVVVLGNLNVTPWSYSFREFLRQTSLRNSARGFGYQPTWPTKFPPLLIPIDHCLVSANVAVVKRSVGPNIGSGHYPLLVDLALTAD